MGLKLMRRRGFLTMAVGAAGAGLLRRVRASPSRPLARARIVIAGGGFAGASCALSLRRLNPTIDVILVDPDERYYTGPMSNSVIAGWRGLDSIGVSRRGLMNVGVKYVRDRVASVDVPRRRVRFAAGGTIAYDRLVIAPGIRFLWGKPEGYDADAARLMPHAWQAGAQTQILAAQLRGMRNGGVVAISVPAGPMRCPPGPFERASLIASYLREHKPRSKVLIFDSNNKFPKQDVFVEAWHSLYPGMIEWIPVVEGGAVLRVAPAKRILYTSNGEHKVDVASVIPPQAPGALAAQAGVASDHGWCPVNPETFESLMLANVHVIGDACIADPMPKAASAANAQANQCALAIVAALDGNDPPAPVYESVCFSALAHGLALSIHGRFGLANGAIQQMQSQEQADSPSAAQEARNAEDWYKEIVLDSFGA